MHALPAADVAQPPRLLRAVGLQFAVLLAAALAAELSPAKRESIREPEQKPLRPERRLRVVQLPKRPPAPLPKSAQRSPSPPPQPKSEPRPAPPVARPQPARPSPPAPAPKP